MKLGIILWKFMELTQTCKTPYMCEIILTGKATVTVNTEPCNKLFKSLNVSLVSLSFSLCYLKGSLPIWQAIASFPQIWIGPKDFSILNLAQYANDF